MSVISIPLRNLVAIIIGVSVAVSGYFALTQRLDMIEKDTEIVLKEVSDLLIEIRKTVEHKLTNE